jgi:phage gpG-like protein
MASSIKSVNFSYVRENLLRDTARMAASESQKFFKECFVKGGWTDTSFQPWKSRQSPIGGKKLMYGIGNLMQSIRKIEETDARVIVGSDTEYAGIHNDGGTITVTAQMKRYWWAQYYKLSGTLKKTKKGKVSKAEGNRKLSAKAEYCKRMALMKVGSKIKIPQRRFIGESQALMTILDRELQTKILEYWEKA